MYLEPLQWTKRGSVLFAKDGPHLRYRITMKRSGDDWLREVQLNSAKIGGSFATLSQAIEYIEHGSAQPRRGQ